VETVKMSYMSRQREAEIRDLEERYASMTKEEVYNAVHSPRTDYTGDDIIFIIDWDEVQAFINEQVDELNNIEDERKRFLDEVEEYKRAGASDREIWGDGDGVSFPEALDFKVARARNNLDTLNEIIKPYGAIVEIDSETRKTWSGGFRDMYDDEIEEGDIEEDN
jgi:hypothetical protein